MAGSDENHPGVIRPANVQGHVGGKFATGMGQNRRALSTINRNILGAPPYPCAVNKRGGLSEKHATFDKNLPIPPHRPITRKFAVQLASKQQPVPKETKKSVQSVPTPNELEDCTLIDVDVPVFVQHTEAMMEEIDRMEEVEMEDIAEETIVDIDSKDKSNPLAVVEYIDDIHAYYKKVEVKLILRSQEDAEAEVHYQVEGLIVSVHLQRRFIFN